MPDRCRTPARTRVVFPKPAFNWGPVAVRPWTNVAVSLTAAPVPTARRVEAAAPTSAARRRVSRSPARRSEPNAAWRSMAARRSSNAENACPHKPAEGAASRTPAGASPSRASSSERTVVPSPTVALEPLIAAPVRATRFAGAMVPTVAERTRVSHRLALRRGPLVGRSQTDAAAPSTVGVARAPPPVAGVGSRTNAAARPSPVRRSVWSAGLLTPAAVQRTAGAARRARPVRAVPASTLARTTLATGVAGATRASACATRAMAVRTARPAPMAGGHSARNASRPTSSRARLPARPSPEQPATT